MELGIITPQQGLDVFNTGRFPNSEDIGSTQEEFVKERKKGYYNPLVGGVPSIAPPAPKLPAGNATPIQPANNLNTTPKSSGRPVGTKKPSSQKVVKAYSQKSIQNIVGKVDNFRKEVEEKLKNKYSIESLNEAQTQMADKLCESIVCAIEMNEWTNKLEDCVIDINQIQNLNAIEKILEISAEHKLEIYPSAILYHSEKDE